MHYQAMSDYNKDLLALNAGSDHLIGVSQSYSDLLNESQLVKVISESHDKAQV